MRRMTPFSLLLLAPLQFAFAPPAAIQAERPPADERTIEDSELKPVAALGCGSESSLKSLNSNTRTFLRFKNKTTKDVTYYWVNFDGKRDQKRTLKPGELHSLWTYLTHPFVFVDGKGQCRAVYLPQKEYGLVVISEMPK